MYLQGTEICTCSSSPVTSSASVSLCLSLSSSLSLGESLFGSASSDSLPLSESSSSSSLAAAGVSWKNQNSSSSSLKLSFRKKLLIDESKPGWETYGSCDIAVGLFGLVPFDLLLRDWLFLRQFLLFGLGCFLSAFTLVLPDFHFVLRTITLLEIIKETHWISYCCNIKRIIKLKALFECQRRTASSVVVSSAGAGVSCSFSKTS